MMAIMKGKYVIMFLFITQISFIDFMFKNDVELQQFIYEWTVFCVLTTVGALARIVYIYDREHSIRLFKIFKVLLYTFFVSFIVKELLKNIGRQSWEIWLLPVAAFSGEVVLSTYGDKIKDIFSIILDSLTKRISNKIKDGNKK